MKDNCKFLYTFDCSVYVPVIYGFIIKYGYT